MGAVAMAMIVVCAGLSMTMRFMTMRILAVCVMAMRMGVVMGVAVPGCHDPWSWRMIRFKLKGSCFRASCHGERSTVAMIL